MKVLRSLAVVGCFALLSCSGSHRSGAPSPPPTATASAASTSSAAATASTTADKTVWLCRPDDPQSPCNSSLVSTAVMPDGSHRPEGAPRPASTGLDCFYVYPTVSPEQTANADLTIQPAERETAVAQAARFSAACRVWAPMYRQRTVHDLFNLAHSVADSPQNLLALASLRTAWRDYLAHDNAGRPVVLIGHSQGASMLIRLIRSDIDPDPALRRQLALAILLGGNVTVPSGTTSNGGALVGGSFQHVPLCTRKGETGCVIAYSSFPSEPPAFSFFGRAGSGVSALSGETATDRQVACVNPAAIGGGSALLHPYIPSARLPQGAASTTWTSFPGRYRAQCRHAGNATWLQVTLAAGGRDPLLREDLGAAGGYHTVDVNLALGDLVSDVLALRP